MLTTTRGSRIVESEIQIRANMTNVGNSNYVNFIIIAKFGDAIVITRFGNLVAVCLLVGLLGRASSGAILHTATYGGHTYHLLDTDGEKWWHEAEAEAIGLGGHLVTIDDAAEDAWVFETFAPLAVAYAASNNLPDQGTISLWIGLSDHRVEGEYEWASGQASTYRNWAGGQPQGGFADEDFAAILVNFIEPGRWHDVIGDSRLADLPFGVVEVARVVPEPSSLTLGTLGGAVAAACGWRRRRRPEAHRSPRR